MATLSRQRQAGVPPAVRWGMAAGFAVLLGLGLGVLAGFGPLVRLDDVVSTALYAGDRRPVWLTVLLETVTAPGLSVFRIAVFLPVLIWLVRRRALVTAAWVVTAVALIGPLTTLLKELVGRVRPAFDNGGARLQSLSFPSGHSSGIATLVTVALVLAWPLLAADRRRRFGLLGGAVVVVVVGLSRMWLGVHYLTDVLGGWALGVTWSLALAALFGALPGGRAALRPPAAEPAVLRQQIVLSADDGSLGPLLRVADDRLAPHAAYGRHRHRAVDVVAVVLAGQLVHRWDGDVPLAAGDVALLQAGTGLEHDERAGPDGARVLQCYLRSAEPRAPARHEVHRAAAGWVDLGRADARLWVGRPGAAVPDGLRLLAGAAAVQLDPGPDPGPDAEPEPGAGLEPDPGPGTRVLVWQLDRGRPDWARG